MRVGKQIFVGNGSEAVHLRIDRDDCTLLLCAKGNMHSLCCFKPHYTLYEFMCHDTER